MKNRVLQSNRIEGGSRGGDTVGIVIGLLLAVLVAGIPAAAGATDVTISVKSGAIPQGHIHHYSAAQGHIHYP